MADTGRPAEALKFYATAEILEQLSRGDPAVIRYQNHLAIVHNNLGAVLSGGAIRRRPSPTTSGCWRFIGSWSRIIPPSADFRNRLCSGRLNLGDLQARDGEAGGSGGRLSRAPALARRLVEEHPSLSDYRNRLSQSHFALARLHHRAGRLAEAEAEFRAAKAIRQSLAEEYPEVAGFHADLAKIRRGLGELLSNMGRRADAEVELRAAAELGRKMVDRHNAVTIFREETVRSLVALGNLHRAEGMATEAVATYRSAVAIQGQIPTPSSMDLYNLACAQALLAGSAGRPGSGLSESEARAEADRAMDDLRRAVAAGFRDARQMRADPDFEPIRERKDFRLLMWDLAFPAEPFARTH